MTLRQKIDANCAAFFELIEGEPEEREWQDWEKQPAASYFRYQEYLRELNED